MKPCSFVMDTEGRFVIRCLSVHTVCCSVQFVLWLQYVYLHIILKMNPAELRCKPKCLLYLGQNSEVKKQKKLDSETKTFS